MNWTIRIATPADQESLHELLVRSVTTLHKGCYSESQIRAAIGPVFGVDEQMIQDATYFVVEEMDPETEAARIRAFFVDPDFARQRIGSRIMKACEDAILAAGFRRGEISATLVGEPLYRRFGYNTVEHNEIPLAGADPLRVARMVKTYWNGDPGGAKD